jgi:uncharacterized protein (DUF885 family)
VRNFTRFQKLAQFAASIIDPEFRRKVFDAINEAEEKAVETVGQWSWENSEEYYGVAYDSIASTTTFAENEDVKQWFLIHGYKN